MRVRCACKSDRALRVEGEAGMNRRPVGRTREPDKAVWALSGRNVAQPATARAKHGLKGTTGEQVWPGVRLEVLAHRAGSPLHPDRDVGVVAWGRHAELESDFGAAFEEQGRGAVPVWHTGPAARTPAYWRGVVRSGRSSRSRGEGGSPGSCAGPVGGVGAKRGVRWTARPLTSVGEFRGEPSEAAVGIRRRVG